HGHRLVASTVGFLTIILAVWLWFAERGWLRWLGVVALGTVVAQGVLGGLTVLFFLPPAISTAHAGLAEIFFCLTVAVALFTSPGWKSATARVEPAVRGLAAATTLVIYAQILVGATMRHTGAGLAIPDFPLMFGGIVPDHWDAKIAVHFAHRAGAVAVALAVIATLAVVLAKHRGERSLAVPAVLLVGLVAAQITLGALTVLSRRDPWINSVHVVCGALVLTTSLVLALRTWRGVIADCGLRIADSIADSGVPIGQSAIQSAIANPQSPIPNPQSAIRNDEARA